MKNKLSKGNNKLNRGLKVTTRLWFILLVAMLIMFSYSNNAISGSLETNATTSTINDLLVDDTAFSVTGTTPALSLYDPEGIGDINDDGYDDFTVRYIGEGNDWWSENKGEVLLFYGGSPGSMSDMTQANANASFIGQTDTGYFGISEGVGDVNGDGIDDFVISEPENDRGVTSNPGYVFLLFGKASGWTMDAPINTVADASFYGESAGDKIGQAWISGLGDVNNDDFDDFAVGTTQRDDLSTNDGKVYIILGRATGWALDQSIAGANASYIGETTEDALGPITRAGDVNNDGYDDFLVSSFLNDEGGTDTGKTYLFLGGPDARWQSDVSVSEANATFVGATPFGYSNVDSDGWGDLNNDGYDDIVINDPNLNTSSGYEGGAQIFWGGPSEKWVGTYSIMDSNASFVGESEDDQATWQTSIIYLNDDNYADLVIAAPGNATSTGKVHVVLGGPTGDFGHNVSISNADMTITGEGVNEGFGRRVTNIGDLDHNGFDDFAIGAGGNDNGTTNGGRHYFVLYLFSTPDEVVDTTTIPSTSTPPTSTPTPTTTPTTTSGKSDENDSPLLIITSVMAVTVIAIIRSRRNKSN